MEAIFLVMMSLSIPVGVIALAFGLQSYTTNKRRTAWQQIAYELGLRYSEDFVYGGLDGQPVTLWTEVRGSGKSSQRYTIVASSLAMPLDLGLGLMKQGFLDDAFSGLFASEDHIIGDPDFDKAVIVRADEPARVMALLSSPDLRASVRALANAGTFHVTDSGCRIERVGSIDNAELLVWFMRLAVRITKLMEQMRARVPMAAPLVPHRAAWHRFAAQHNLAACDTPLAMWGTLDGDRMTAFANRVDRLSFGLKVTISFAQSLAAGINLRPANTMDAVSRFFGFTRRDETGDADFDRTFSVHAADAERARLILSDNVRTMIRNLNARVGVVTMIDDSVAVEARWLSRRPEDAMFLVEHVRELARVIERNAHGQDKRIGPYR